MTCRQKPRELRFSRVQPSLSLAQSYFGHGNTAHEVGGYRRHPFVR